jgi:hypothetical protein
MKKSELEKLFANAEVEKVEDRKKETQRVYVEKLNREFYVESSDQTFARDKALEIVLAESDNIRGFEISE